MKLVSRWLATLLLVVTLGCGCSIGCSTTRPFAEIPQTTEIEKLPPPAASIETYSDLVTVRFDGVISDDAEHWVSMMLEAHIKGGAKALLVIFNSPGGSVDAGERISRDIEGSKIPVYCVVDGEAASMGFYILQSCKLRFMTRRSILMIHEPSMAIEGTRFDHQKASKVLEILVRAMAEHESRRLKITMDELLTKTADANWFMGWSEALKIGAVDWVVANPDEVTSALLETLQR